MGLSTMFRYLSFLVLTTFLFVSNTNAQDESASQETTEKIAKPNPKVRFETNVGNFTVELFADKAPNTVKNFLAYVDSGFYKGTIFHRVIKNFMVQGGGFTKEMSKKKTRKPIKNEASKALSNERGTIAMARLSAPDTATSQFFINVQDNPNLDYRKWNPGYAVFGKVSSEVEMAVLDNIAYSETGNIGIHRDAPVNAIEILDIVRVTD